MAFCESCGAEIKASDQFCENCGAAVGTSTTTPAPAQTSSPDIPIEEKNPILAAIASLIVAGLGQVYNGSLKKGLLIFFGSLIGSMLFFVPGLIVLAYGIYDAYTTAKKMNTGEIPFVPYKSLHIIGFIVIVFVVIILYFLVIFSLAMTLGSF